MADYSTSIPAFIAKLWEMVNDEKYDSLIQWSKDGTSFLIKEQTKFCSELLPIYYKHNNMASFIRQLNKYGFKKVVSVDSASLKNDRNELEFSHPHFLKHYPALLTDIKRKISANGKGEMNYPDVMVQIVREVQQLQQKQSIFESKLRTMKNENTALWREHSILRHKHQNLQKLLNKLIQFLLTLVQQTRGMNIKRINLPLMIKDSPHLSTDGFVAIKNNSNMAETSESKSETFQPEIIVPDILDDENAADILSEINTLNDTDSSSIQGLSSDHLIDNLSSTVAVPLQEVSPALVYGKYIGAPKQIEHKPQNSSSLIINKLGKKNPQDKTAQNTKKKVVLKQYSSATSNPSTKRSKVAVPRLVKINSSQPKSLSQETLLKKPQLQVSTTTGNEVADSSNFSINSDVGIIECNADIKNLNQGLNTVLDNDVSLPIIVSPSGTQLSPAGLVESENQLEVSSQNVPSPKEDNKHFEPLQKEIDNHIGTIQSDLDILKDLLQGEGISIDASTFLGFMNDDPLSLNMPESLGLPSEAASSGNELISYNTPSLLDIVEIMDNAENTDYDNPLPTPSVLNTPKPEFSYDIGSPSPSKRMKK